LKRQLETSCQPALIPTIFKSSNSDGPICPSLFLFGFVVKNLGNSLAKDIKYEISFINGKSSESTIDVYCDFYKKGTISLITPNNKNKVIVRASLESAVNLNLRIV